MLTRTFLRRDSSIRGPSVSIRPSVAASLFFFFFFLFFFFFCLWGWWGGGGGGGGGGEQENVLVFNDTIGGPRAPAVKGMPWLVSSRDNKDTKVRTFEKLYNFYKLYYTGSLLLL